MVTESKRKSNNKWDSNNMRVLGCKVKKANAELYKQAARAQGTTINTVLKQALENLLINASKENRE